MADRLMTKGHTVTGNNRTKSKAQWLIDKGMKWSDTPKGVAQSADVVFSMVTDSAASNRSPTVPTARCRAGPGKILIDMSTVSPAASRALADKVRATGADMVDSPVSGSVITLEQGKLTMMVGGRVETFEKIKPLLLDIGPKATHVGDNGLAVSMKIATNLNLAVQMLAFSESVLLAEKSGIPRKTAVECSPTASSPRPW
jgi:3-hydroxyisobutyrate dehydrogenase-like beta-hydroxyacid dehydrogenase